MAKKRNSFFKLTAILLLFLTVSNAHAASTCKKDDLKQVSSVFIVMSNTQLEIIGQPRGPDVVLAFLTIGESLASSLDRDGIDISEGKAYLWRKKAGEGLGYSTLSEVSYLCDFDKTLKTKEIGNIFLK